MASITETPNIRITYWAGRGKAERLRCLLAAADVQFENIFLQCPEDLDSLRNAGKLDYGQVPLVEIDGLNLVQSMSTLLYLAEKYSFLPTNNLKERHEILSIVFAAEDSRIPLLRFPFTDCDKNKCLEGLHDSKGLFQRYLPKWEEKIIMNKQINTSSPYFVGTTPTVADITVFEILDFFRHVFGEDELQLKLKSFPHLLSLYDAVLNLGRMKVWRNEERPKLFLDFPEYSRVVRKTLGA